MHPFDEWFDLVYPAPQPVGTRQSSLVAWNAAIHAACESLSVAKDQFVLDRHYEQAATARDLIEQVRTLTRRHD
jgi:hypothetical protein